MIVRRRHNHSYTQIGNAAINDDRLPYEALGVLIYLLSKPHDWSVQLSHLRRRQNIGRDKMRRIVGELVKAGYILRKKVRDASGAFLRDEFLVFDEPRAADEEGIERVAEEAVSESEPAPENPALDQPAPGYPAPEKASLATIEETKDREEQRTDSTKVEREARARAPEQPERSDGVANGAKESDPRPWERDEKFMAAAKLWGPLDSLAASFREWTKLNDDPMRERAVRRIASYQAMHAVRAKRCAFSRFLAERIFEHLPDPERQAGASALVQIERFTRDFWAVFHRRRLAAPHERDQGSGRTLNFLAGHMLSFTRQHRCGLSVPLPDAPSDAERAGLVAVEVGTEAYAAWMNALGKAGLDIRDPEISGKRVFMPSAWPEGGEPERARVLSVDEELGIT